MKNLALSTLLLACGLILFPVQIQADEVTIESLYPGLTTGPLRLATAATLPDGTLMQFDQQSIYEKDVTALITGSRSASLKAQLNKNKFFVLENIAFNQALLSSAKKWAIETKYQGKEDDSSLLDAYISGLEKGIVISDKVAQEYFNSNVDDFGGVPFDQAAEAVQATLRNDRLTVLVNALVDEKLGKATTLINSQWLKKEAPSSLNNDADKARYSKKVSLLEFGSKGCPACVRIAPVIDELRNTYAGRALIVPVSLDDDMIIGDRYGITLIPTLIFFNEDGKEEYRHIGIMSREDIVNKLAELGVK